MLKFALGFLLLLAGAATPAEAPTRNELLTKLFTAARTPEAKPVRSVRIVISGASAIEYLRKDNRSLQRENGELSFIYDGTRNWTRGEGISGGDPSWFMQFAFAIETLPELFGRLVQVENHPWVLLGQRNAYREVALIAVNPESGLFDSVTTFRLENRSVRKTVTPTGFRRVGDRVVPTGFRIGDREYKIESVEWDIELDDALFQIPEEKGEKK